MIIALLFHGASQNARPGPPKSQNPVFEKPALSNCADRIRIFDNKLLVASPESEARSLLPLDDISPAFETSLCWVASYRLPLRSFSGNALSRIKG
jgi:hypothetical protein